MAFCILVSGPPASGKSTLSREIGERLGLAVFSKDDIKEMLFDEIGFSSREEKVRLGRAAERIMLDCARRTLRAGQCVVIENNFESVGKEAVVRLIEESGCGTINVRLTGDMRALWERYARRNGDPARHRGHVVNDCWPEKEPDKAVPPIPYEDFVKGVQKRGMCGFDVGGAVIDVDTTADGGADAAQIAQRIGALMAEERR